MADKKKIFMTDGNNPLGDLDSINNVFLRVF